jgi:hypothetical protein
MLVKDCQRLLKLLEAAVTMMLDASAVLSKVALDANHAPNITSIHIHIS